MSTDHSSLRAYHVPRCKLVDCTSAGLHGQLGRGQKGTGVQAAMLARGRKVRQSRLLFYAKLAEKALQTYERDGWGEFPTHINLDRREVRLSSSCPGCSPHMF